MKHGKELIYKLTDEKEVFLGDIENLAFLGAASVLSSLRLDFNAEDYIKNIPYLRFHGNIKMEEVTKEPKRMEELLFLLSEGVVTSNEQYMKNVYHTGIINQHKNDPNKIDSRKRYEQFSDLQKEVFLYFMKKFNLKSEYERIGYDLSYI